MQLAGILYVHNLITDIVGSFHEIYQRIADKLVIVFRIADYPQLGCDAQISLFFRLKETKLPLLARVDGCVRIFYDGGERAVCHCKASLSAALELVGQEAHGVGIPLKVEKVFPTAAFLAYCLFQSASVAFQEICGDGSLARMPERRITHVVCQAGGRDNRPYLQEINIHVGIFPHEPFGNVVAQRTSHARHLQAMCKSIVYKDASRKRKYLRLVLQSAEGG